VLPLPGWRPSSCRRNAGAWLAFRGEQNSPYDAPVGAASLKCCCATGRSAKAGGRRAARPPPAARDRRALLAALGLTQEGLAVRPHPPCVDLARAPDTIGGLAERQGDGPAPRRDALRPASLAARANAHGRAQRGATKVHPSDGGLSCGERGQLVPVSNTTRVRRAFLLEIGGHPGRPTPLTARLASCGAANGGNKWPPRKAA
jgi:hypothetical protein